MEKDDLVKLREALTEIFHKWATFHAMDKHNSVKLTAVLDEISTIAHTALASAEAQPPEENVRAEPDGWLVERFDGHGRKMVSNWVLWNGPTHPGEKTARPVWFAAPIPPGERAAGEPVVGVDMTEDGAHVSVRVANRIVYSEFHPSPQPLAQEAETGQEPRAWPKNCTCKPFNREDTLREVDDECDAHGGRLIGLPSHPSPLSLYEIRKLAAERGCAVVPREPTQAMVAAAPPVNTYDMLIAVYRAMLQAAAQEGEKPSLSQQLANGRQPSARQIEVLENIWEKVTRRG